MREESPWWACECVSGYCGDHGASHVQLLISAHYLDTNIDGVATDCEVLPGPPTTTSKNKHHLSISLSPPLFYNDHFYPWESEHARQWARCALARACAVRTAYFSSQLSNRDHFVSWVCLPWKTRLERPGYCVLTQPWPPWKSLCRSLRVQMFILSLLLRFLAKFIFSELHSFPTLTLHVQHLSSILNIYSESELGAISKRGELCDMTSNRSIQEISSFCEYSSLIEKYLHTK